MNLSHDITVMLPELVIAIGALVLLMVGAFAGNKWQSVLSSLSLLVMAGAGWFVVTGMQGSAFSGAFRADDFARFLNILVLIGGAGTLVMAQPYLQNERIANFEFPILILLATLGMMLMVSAAGFIALYMGLELQSLALYVLAAFHRDNERSTEAGLKYFVLGALSSGMLLYGISLIYGFTGTVTFDGVAAVIHTSGVNIGLIFGIVFLITGLAFKVSAVPFHMWSPDVYEGAPTPVTAFFTTAPKVAAMGLFVRALIQPFPDALHQWQQVIVVISALSMILGAVAAIGQTNIKRLMAYSSIGHAGFILLGLAAGTPMGIESVLIYLTIYLVTGLGTFACILAMRRDGENVETINDLAGLSRTRPRMAFIFAALMFSLAGIPPVAGFFAKFYVFLAAIEAHLYVLSVIGVLASVVGAYYYLRIVKIMYFDEPAPAFEREIGPRLSGVMALSGAFTILFVLGAAPLVTAATTAAQALFK
ncbi:MAG TPA: NADH-quinone oxidoreductase subunit NuoN [Rhizomicrobium sp.]|jgi:NADH-quinone oxidoreductase subunit N|nr:NADH-quinone oxidoreductase subunit NuoN [Rhizomicrobium sp.]